MHFRLICKSYTYYIHQDEPGGHSSPEQHISEPETLWEDELDQAPDREHFDFLDLPADDCDGCACEGSSEFSYSFQKWHDDKWEFVHHI